MKYINIFLASSVEEFEVALEQFRSGGTPLIYTYFLELPEKEQADQSVLDFMEQLDKQLGHYYSIFTHLDTVKLDMMLEMSRNPELNSEMKFEDGWAVFNGKQIVSLENIPMYSKNDALQELVKERAQLDEVFAELAERYGRAPGDRDSFSKLLKVSEQRNRITESIHQMETGMLELHRRISEKQWSGEKLN